MTIISAKQENGKKWAPAIGHLIYPLDNISKEEKKKLLNILFSRWPQMSFYKIRESSNGAGGVKNKIFISRLQENHP